ncbi:MAG: hypothetical protein LBO72_08055 [Helicobacteraceae bacterium]|nr:hypothetical protein [Helicobacteraceae bacterium]
MAIIINGKVYPPIDFVSGASGINGYYPVHLGESPLTQEEYQAAYEAASGSSSGSLPQNGATLVNLDNNHVITYFANANGDKWIDRGYDTVSTANNEGMFGVITGSTANGEIGITGEGKGALNGYDAILANINAVSGVANRAVSTAWTFRGDSAWNYKRVARISGHNRELTVKCGNNNYGTIPEGAIVSLHVPNNEYVLSKRDNSSALEFYYVDNPAEKWTELYVKVNWYGFKILSCVGQLDATEAAFDDIAGGVLISASQVVDITNQVLTQAQLTQTGYFNTAEVLATDDLAMIYVEQRVDNFVSPYHLLTAYIDRPSKGEFNARVGSIGLNGYAVSLSFLVTRGRHWNLYFNAGADDQAIITRYIRKQVL